MRWLSMFVASIVGLQPTFAASPLEASILFDRCSAFIQNSDAAEGELCDVYLRGFLQGVKSAGGKQRSSENDESWTDRAARTRIGDAALARASYCVPEGLTPARLAKLFVQHAEANPDLKNIDARSALEATLYVNYRCTAYLLGGRAASLAP